MDEDDRQAAEYHQWTLEQQQQEEELKKARYEPFLTAYFSDCINNIMKENRMATLEEQVAEALGDALHAMNTHINTHGEIERSSLIIKGWHTYDNTQWELILAGAKHLNDEGKIHLPGKIERDIDFLLEHLDRFRSHHDNILYPTVKDTENLPSAITHADRSKYDVTIKTRTFRTMMSIRESLCKSLDIDLPNSDLGKGKLDPTPYEEMFQ